MLEPLGLDSAVEAVYRLLLAEPGWTVADVASHLGWPAASVRAALDRLAELRLVRPETNRVVNPQIGLSALLARSEADLARKREQIEASRLAVADLAVAYDGFDAEIVERLDSLDAVRDRLTELAQAAATECLSLSPGAAESPDAVEASRQLDGAALRRGVALRGLYQDCVRNDQRTLRHLRWLRSLGADVRTTPTLPVMLVIVDRQVALLPIEPADPRQGALVLRSHGVVMALCAWFEQLWRGSAPLDGDRVLDDDGLSAPEKELLRLLSAGDTDEMVARKLGVSLRTVRRSAAALMSRLGARSRFEAGVLAARRGWV